MGFPVLCSTRDIAEGEELLLRYDNESMRALHSGCARFCRTYSQGYEKVIMVPAGSLRAPEVQLSDLRSACGSLHLPNCHSARYRRLDYAGLTATILSSPHH